MSFTVVPLHNLTLPAGTQIPFGKGFNLQDVPAWVTQDEGALKNINSEDRQATLHAKHALIAEYEADCLGFPDPEWHGQKPMSLQELRFQSAMLANLAIWLRQPSTVCFTVCFHALIDAAPNQEGPIILSTQSHKRLYCHPKDFANQVSIAHVAKAGELHSILSTVTRKNAVWSALRAIWAALTSFQPGYRYALFWQGLESLFGANDYRRGIRFRLCDRISVFLADTPDTRKALFEKVDGYYETRSAIVHGRWEEGPEIEAAMADTEAIVRTVVRHLLERPGMLPLFMSEQRNDFLERWVVSKSLTPPPFPK